MTRPVASVRSILSEETTPEHFQRGNRPTIKND